MPALRSGLVLLCLLVPPLSAIQRPQGRASGLASGSFTISGTVTDDDHTPVAGFLVRPFLSTYDSIGATNLRPAGDAVTTDASGRYVLSGLTPEIYVVSVTAATDPLSTSVYYPSATDWRAAEPVRITDSSVSSIDLSIPRKQMVQVSGPIFNAAEPGARVAAFYMSRTDDPSTMLWKVRNTASNTQASFQMEGISPGTYDVFPEFGKPRGPTRVGHVRLAVSPGLQGVTIRIVPGVDVLGQIHVRRFDDSPSLDLTDVKVQLLSRKGEQVSPGPVSVRADGSFLIPHVAEMEYQVSVTGLAQNAYVEAAQFDDTDALNSWVNVRRFSQRLQIVVDTAGGEIHGRLLDLSRNPFSSSASLVLVPVQRKGTLPGPGFVVVPAERRGTFTIPAVPPGDYRLLAWHEPNGHPYLNEEFMKGYLGMGDVVHVNRGSRIQADAIVVDTR